MAASKPDPAALALSVLVVDDEPNIRSTVTVCLEHVGCTVVAVATPELALAATARQRFDLALVDLRLGQANGLDLIPKLLAESPTLLVAIITAYATVDNAVEAMRRGAWDYLPKPFTPAQVRSLAEKAAERRRLGARLSALESRLAAVVPEVELASQSPAMGLARDTIARAATADVPVLLRGETGTGKSVAARTLHAQSRRADGPFVVVNCPTLSEELLASELFGHVRGAFTGAVKDQPGRVEAAHGGTLFLDEIGEIPPPLQAKLLRFLQDKEFERVGEGRTRRADVRVVAATNRDLDADVRAGRFREDLLFRLNVVEVTIPALRDRPDDVLALARHFVAFYARALGRAASLSADAETALVRYGWPGNVRELRNAIERALILWPAPVIEPEAFPAKMQLRAGKDAPLRIGGPHTLAAIEAAHVAEVVRQAPSLDEAAETLGIDASTLWRKRKKLEGDG